MRADRLQVKFGVPEHGWLPVTVIAPGFELELDASDVPVNSVELLVSALILTLEGVESEVPWFLEPDSYLFSFRPKDAEFSFRIEYKDYRRPIAKPKYEVDGNFTTIILPFYRAIKSFASYHYAEPHWPELDLRSINKLSELVRKRKFISRPT